MTPEERERTDGLAASAFQLATDLAEALIWAEASQVIRVRAELDRVCRELAPLLIQYEDEQQAWRERRFH